MVKYRRKLLTKSNDAGIVKRKYFALHRLARVFAAAVFMLDKRYRRAR